MAGDSTTTTDTAYPMRGLTERELADLLDVLARIAAPEPRVSSSASTKNFVEDAPRDAQPARLSGEVL